MQNRFAFLAVILALLLGFLGFPGQVAAQTPTPTNYPPDKTPQDLMGGYWYVTLDENSHYSPGEGILSGYYNTPGDGVNIRLLQYDAPADVCGTPEQFVGIFQRRDAVKEAQNFALKLLDDTNIKYSVSQFIDNNTINNNIVNMGAVDRTYLDANHPGWQTQWSTELNTNVTNPAAVGWRYFQPNTGTPVYAQAQGIYFAWAVYPNMETKAVTRITIRVICKGEKPSASMIPGPCFLGDCPMEQQPMSQFWFPDTAKGLGKFGRLDNGNLLQVGYGDPRCDLGWQIIGNTNRCGWSILDFYNTACHEAFAPIRQEFFWPGGTAYWRFSAKGLPDNGWNRTVNIAVWISNAQTGAQTVLFRGAVGSEWEDKSGKIIALPTGDYVIRIFKDSGNAENDAFFVDDVYISDKHSSVPCSVEPATTATPTPPNYPTASATAPGVAGKNLILNCGFGQGDDYWEFQSITDPMGGNSTDLSFVIYGPNNYSHALNTSPSPAVAQPFYWPGGTAYVRFESNTNWNVTLQNQSTGEPFIVSMGNQTVTGWITRSGFVPNMPKGSYKILLHHPQGAGPSQYDNISVSTGNYTTCNEAGLNWTPTPPPTATQEATPTMWPTYTQQPTATVPTGMPSSTPRPTFTPLPSFTPYKSPYPTITPRPSATLTPYPTYTRQPTYTPRPTYTMQPTHTMAPVEETAGAPTYTPWPTYTPDPNEGRGLPTEAPPPQPPPGYYAPCDRPQNGYDIANWIEYDQCVVLSYLEMSPNAVSTVAAVPTMFSRAEPFGLFEEVRETNQQMQDMIQSYSWETGLDGTKDKPDPSIFLAPIQDSPLITGEFDFTPSGNEPISQECDAALTDVVGPLLSPGMCFAFNILKEKGILPWLQLVVNIIFIIILLVYIWKKWIDAGTGGG